MHPQEPTEKEGCCQCCSKTCVRIPIEDEPRTELIPLQSLNQPVELRMEDFYASDTHSSFSPKLHFDKLENVIRELIDNYRRSEPAL